MAEHKSGGGGGANLTTDFLWFLGIIVGLFFVWVMMGGPEKARQKKLGPIIGPGQSQSQGTPNQTQGMQGGQQGASSSGSSSSSGGVRSGEIQVTPL